MDWLRQQIDEGRRIPADNDSFRKQVGKNLQSLRKAAGFSSAASFAQHVGINEDTYTGYEQGKGMFTYERAWKMADALECSMDDLGGRRWRPDRFAPERIRP